MTTAIDVITNGRHKVGHYGAVCSPFPAYSLSPTAYSFVDGLQLRPHPLHRRCLRGAGVVGDEEIAARQEETAWVAEAPGHHVLPEILELARTGCARFRADAAVIEGQLPVAVPGVAKIFAQHQAQRGGIVAMDIGGGQTVAAERNRLTMLAAPTGRNRRAPVFSRCTAPGDVVVDIAGGVAVVRPEHRDQVSRFGMGGNALVPVKDFRIG